MFNDWGLSCLSTSITVFIVSILLFFPLFFIGLKLSIRGLAYASIPPVIVGTLGLFLIVGYWCHTCCDTCKFQSMLDSFWINT
jgi:hypothetical protein